MKTTWNQPVGRCDKISSRNRRLTKCHWWFDWLPIFDLGADDVFRVIRDAGQSPHWVYAEGMSRCSCSLCIFSSTSALRRAAELRPGLYRKYVEIEKRIGHTLSPSGIPLPEITGIPADSATGTPGLSDRLLAEESAGP